MKTLFLFLVLISSIHAAPITFSYEGSYSPIANGIFVNLQDHPYNSAEDRTVTIIASAPIVEFNAYFDNLPNSVGSGFVLYLDDVLVLNTGLGNMVCTTLSLTSGSPFTHIRVETNSALYWMERGTITHLNGIIADDPLPPSTITAIHNPEPSTLLLMIPAVLLCVWKAKRRASAGEASPS